MTGTDDIVIAPRRVLATILFTDIVAATEAAARLGDQAWIDLLRQHHAAVRRRLADHGGRELDTAGDGFFAAFDTPGQAISCAFAIRDDLAALGLQMRAGIHTGECEPIDAKLTGIAVHLGARIAAEAGAGDVLVSGTVRDIVAGAGFGFRDRGRRRLKGMPERYRLFAVAPPPADRGSNPRRRPSRVEQARAVVAAAFGRRVRPAPQQTPDPVPTPST